MGQLLLYLAIYHMNTALKIIFSIAVLVLVIVLIVKEKKAPEPVTSSTPVAQENSIEGCYVATLAKDVYTLTVLDQSGGTFSGSLTFKNFEKDSSSGTFNGTYADGILLGEYAFQSEGMDSVMQVIFKKTGENFVRGYGDVDALGTHFTSLSDITYDTNAVFVKTDENCSVS